MTTKPPVCFECKHFNIEAGNCEAFPDEIPDVILLGDDDHKKPLPEQDNKIVFEPISKN